MQTVHLNLHRGRGNRFDMTTHQSSDVLWLLIGHQAHRDLGMCPAWQHSLASRLSITTPDPIHVQRGSDRGSLWDCVLWLSPIRRYTGTSKPGTPIEWDSGQYLPFLCCQVPHPVIEAWDGHMPVRILQATNDPTQRIDRVVHRPPVAARMQVMLRSGDLYLQVDQPPQSIDDTRQIFGKDPRIRDECQVSGKQVPMRSDERFETRTPGLLLPFEQAFDIHWRCARRHVIGLGNLHMDIKLSLVIRSTAREQILPTYRWLKGLRLPLIQRIHRLHIIMPIDQNRERRRARGQPLGVDHGMALGRHHLGTRKPGSSQAITEPGCRSLHVRLMLSLGTYAGDTQKLHELFQEPLTMLLYVVKRIHQTPPTLKIGAIEPHRNRPIAIAAHTCAGSIQAGTSTAGSFTILDTG